MRQTQRHEMSKKKSSPKGKRKLEFIEKKKTKTPLTGKTIFLDIKEARIKQRIEADILKLGATVEGFLSKDINYLITATPPAKHTKHDGKFGSPESPAISTPSPFNMGPSPSPSNPENIKKPVPTVSRGKAIYDKAKIAKKSNIVVENAQKWGVKIVGLEVAQKWIKKEVAKLPNDSKKGSQEKKGCSLSSNGGAFKAKKLKSPFVKFEDISNQYRVVYQHLTTWPHVNVDTPKGTCPFDGTRAGRDDESIVDRRDKIGLQNLEQHSDDELAQGNSDSPNVDGKIKKSDSAGIIGPVRIVTAGEIRRRAERKRLQEKKRGYCECCQIKYENLDKHIREEQHKTFVKDKNNYESLDHLMKTATNCNTAKFLQRTLTNHLQKGRQSSEDVDVSIPEAKQWTPRKSTVTKLMMKNQRKKKFKMEKDDAKQNKSFDKNKHEEDSDLESTKIKSPIKTKESVVYDGENEHASKVTNHTNCDGSDVKVDEHITTVYHSPIRARRSRNGTGSSKKDTTVVDRLNNMTIDSPMQTNATNLNTSGMETNQNVQMDSSLNKSTNEHSEINKVRKNKNRNDGSDKKTVKEEDMNNSSSTIKVCIDHDKNYERKNSIQKIERNNTEPSQQTVEKKITLNQNEGFPDPHHKKSGEVRENIFGTFSSVTATCINKDAVENKMDIENHYVPKIAKEFVVQQNMSQNRVDWGDKDSGISNYVANDEKTVKKRWSQKLMSEQQHVNEDNEVQKNIVDEVDGMIVDASSQESLKICTVKNIAEKSNKNTSERVLKKLTRKFCDEKTIYLNMNDKELSDISPVVKGRERPPKSPLFGKSPSTKYQRKLQVPKAEDVYDFDDSPQKNEDVFDFDSEISLIYLDSPSLSRKKKTHSKELENVAVKKKINLLSPKSGISNSPQSAKRNMWHKKISTPKSDSKMKKLDKLKVQVARCDMETSTNVDSSSELHVDNKNCEILTKETSANKSVQSVNKDSVHNNKLSSVQRVNKDSVHNNKLSSVQRVNKDSVHNNKLSSVQRVDVDCVHKKKSSSIQSVNKDKYSVHNNKLSSVQRVDVDCVHKKKSSSIQSVNKDVDCVHKKKSSSIQSVNKDLDSVHKKRSSSIQSVNKDVDNVHKKKSSSVQSVNKDLDNVHKKKSSSVQSVNKDVDCVHKKRSSSIQSVNKDVDNVHKKKSSSVQSVNKDLDNVHKKKSSSVQSVNKDVDCVHKKRSSSIQSVNKDVDCVHKKRSSMNSRSCKSNVSPSSSSTCVSLSTNDCNENIQRRTNNSTGTTETIEMSAFTSHLPKSVHNVIDNSKFCISSPMYHTGNGDAIKRLSPSKSFDPESIDNVDIEMNSPEKNPQKSSQKNKQFDDSGQVSGKKEKSQRNKLVWMSAEINKKKSKTFKLNASISLLSDRSFGKLLTSEDGNEQFEGFSQEDITAVNTLGSDASFVETTEIDLDENSHQEWVMDAEMIMNEDSKFDTLVPDLPSPGKRSDSSWGEACEDFIQSQLSFNTSLSKSNMTSPSSPRRVPLYFGSMMSSGKRKRLSSIEEEENTVLLTPKRKNKRMKLIKNGIEKIDDDIEFNHLSPQKIKSFRSPSKNNRETICSSSPLNDLKQKTLRSVSNTDSNLIDLLPNLSGKVNKKSSTKNKQKKYSEKPQKSEDKNKSTRKSKVDKKN